MGDIYTVQQAHESVIKMGKAFGDAALDYTRQKTKFVTEDADASMMRVVMARIKMAAIAQRIFNREQSIRELIPGYEMPSTISKSSLRSALRPKDDIKQMICDFLSVAGNEEQLLAGQSDKQRQAYNKVMALPVWQGAHPSHYEAPAKKIS